MPDVTLLYFDGCPSWQTADERLRTLQAELGFDLSYEKVETPEAAVARSFRGSPTILVDGRDVFAKGDEPVGLSCRIFQTPDGAAGAPTVAQLREVLSVPRPGELDAIDAAIAAASPELDAQDRALVRTTYTELGAGRARTPEELAALAGTDPADAAERFDRWPGVFRDDEGRVVGFWGLAIPEMPHRLAFDDGAEVHAWCAWDPLFLAPIVGRATVTTADPVSGATITYRVGPEGVEGADAAQVLSFLQPADTWDEDVLGTFCHFVLHFESAETGERWVSDHPGTFLLSLRDAAELGRRHAERLTAR